jgi:hypothetical protein
MNDSPIRHGVCLLQKQSIHFHKGDFHAYKSAIRVVRSRRCVVNERSPKSAARGANYSVERARPGLPSTSAFAVANVILPRLASGAVQATPRLTRSSASPAIDAVPARLKMAEDGGAETINYEEQNVYEALMDKTGGRGPDACIDDVGMEAHAPGIIFAYDRVKQAMMLETDRPHALREAIMCCRNGGTISVIGVYGGFIDKFPMVSVMNRSLHTCSVTCGHCWRGSRTAISIRASL